MRHKQTVRKNHSHRTKPHSYSVTINLRTLRKKFGNINKNRLDSTKPRVSKERNKYLFALTRKFSSIASDNLVGWITFFSVQVNI